MARADKETEIKLPVEGISRIRRRLQGLGFRVVQRRSFEHNEIYDTKGHHLRKAGQLLRLRTVNGLHTLTFKGPVEFSSFYKVRAESETTLSDPRTLRAALAALELTPRFRYQKFRTVFAGRGRWRGGEAMLDETPIGAFLELEGNPRWIRRLARELGAGPESFITKNYRQLFVDWCRRHGRATTDMVFPGGVSA